MRHALRADLVQIADYLEITGKSIWLTFADIAS
jgi:hypothetical protein